MDFDEYEYLEKAVENPEPEKVKETVIGGEETVKSEDRDRDRRRSSKHKSDENGNDSSHRSKRTKSRDESREHDRERGDRDRERERGDRDRERERERGDRDRGMASSRHRSSPRDEERSERDRYKSSRENRDREKHKEKEDRNGKDRDRSIEREKDRERERRVRGRENDKERESERERSHRSRSHSERQRDEPDRENGRDKERSQDREFIEREKEKELREKDRGNRRYKEKREDAAEPEVDPERDQRTVFAYQICLKADERDVYEFFSRAGKVRDVRLIMDRNSRRSKGVGYIEFYDAMSVPMAIALSGQTLLSHPVMVKPSEAEKNLVQSTASVAGGAGGLIGPYSGGARRLYIGNLHFNIREDQLRQVFEPFGAVELVQLPLDQETGHSKGYGFVQFARLEDARAAESLNGQLEIAGRAIKVSAITDQAGMQDIGANPGDFDDDEGGGLSLNARSRAILMQKLDRSGTASSITGTLGNPAVNSPGLALPTVPILGAAATGSSLVAPITALAGLTATALSVPAITVPSVDIVGVPSECLLLKNMFDPNSESEPDFDLDIKEDVQEECSKYGTLKHIFVDKDTDGFVYLRFDNTQAALGAQRALHGRWFAGKMITATFMLPQNYESKFPDSSR